MDPMIRDYQVITKHPVRGSKLRQKLTNRFIRDTTRPSDKDTYYWDDGGGSVKGLGLRVKSRPYEKKTFIFQYRIGGGRAGKTKRITLGEPSPALNIERARALASGHRLTVRNGGDPAVEVRKAQEEIRKSSGRSFEVLLGLYVDYVREKLKSSNEVERVLRREFLPVWRDRDVAGISRKEIKVLLEGIRSSGRPYLANKALDVVRTFFKYVMDEDKITASPAVGIERPFNPPVGGRDRVLSDAELVKVWKAAGEEHYPFGPYIRLLILTLARRCEVSDMNTKELDQYNGLWEIPAARSKNGKPLVVPLSAIAWDIIDDLHKQRGGLLFTTNGDVPISGFGKFKRRFDKRLEGVEPWRLHDLRRTGAIGLTKMGVVPDIVDRCLNHVPRDPTGTRAVYDKWGYLPEKTEALRRWADYVLALVAAADVENVVKIEA